MSLKRDAVKTDVAVGAVVLLAAAVTGLAVRQAREASFRPLTPVNLLVLVAMFAIVTGIDLVPVTLSRLAGRSHANYVARFSVSDAVVIAAAIGYGAIIGIIVAALGRLITHLLARRELRKGIFNIAQFICCAGIAGLVYYTLIGTARQAPLASFRTTIAAICASALYVLVNDGLFAFVVGTATGRSPVTIFIAQVPGFLLQNITLQAVGLLLATVRDLNPLSLVIVLLPLLGPYVAMQGHRDTVREIRQTIEALADSVDKRDVTTAQHSERVAGYTQQIIDELGTIKLAEAEAILLAARVHDLGKIGIPDAVLLKPGRLDEEEYRMMRDHPVYGDEILRKLSIYRESLGVVRHHHERYDGKGYPAGIAGEEIPFGARIVAVADVFDVMTSDRPYSRARTVQEAKEELIACKGTQFDPAVVDAFIAVLDRKYGAAPVPATLTRPAEKLVAMASARHPSV